MFVWQNISIRLYKMFPLLALMCRDQHVRVNYLNVLPDKWVDYAWNPMQFPLDTE